MRCRKRSDTFCGNGISERLHLLFVGCLPTAGFRSGKLSKVIRMLLKSNQTKVLGVRVGGAQSVTDELCRQNIDTSTESFHTVHRWAYPKLKRGARLRLWLQISKHGPKQSQSAACFTCNFDSARLLLSASAKMLQGQQHTPAIPSFQP